MFFREKKKIEKNYKKMFFLKNSSKSFEKKKTLWCKKNPYGATRPKGQ